MNERLCTLVCHEGKVNYQTKYNIIEFRCIRVRKQFCPYNVQENEREWGGNISCKYLHPGDICSNKFAHIDALDDLNKFMDDFIMTDPYDLIHRDELDRAEQAGNLEEKKIELDRERDVRFRNEGEK